MSNFPTIFKILNYFNILIFVKLFFQEFLQEFYNFKSLNF